MEKTILLMNSGIKRLIKKSEIFIPHIKYNKKRNKKAKKNNKFVRILKEFDVLKESVGSRLKTFRLSKKATQKEMASALGCAVITYNRYERETNLPSTENLSLLYHMGCNLNWLITGEEEMSINEAKYENNLTSTVNKQTDIIAKQVDIIKEQANTIEEYRDMINTTISKCRQHVEISGTGNSVGNHVFGINSTKNKFNLKK